MRVSALINKKKLDDNHQRENVFMLQQKKKKPLHALKDTMFLAWQQPGSF